MIERRALKRMPINRAALLSFDGIRGTHPCMVRDISALGACISAPYYIFANEFVLSFDGHSGNLHLPRRVEKGDALRRFLPPASSRAEIGERFRRAHKCGAT